MTPTGSRRMMTRIAMAKRMTASTAKRVTVNQLGLSVGSILAYLFLVVRLASVVVATARLWGFRASVVLLLGDADGDHGFIGHEATDGFDAAGGAVPGPGGELEVLGRLSLAGELGGIDEDADGGAGDDDVLGVDGSDRACGEVTDLAAGGLAVGADGEFDQGIGGDLGSLGVEGAQAFACASVDAEDDLGGEIFVVGALDDGPHLEQTIALKDDAGGGEFEVVVVLVLEVFLDVWEADGDAGGGVFRGSCRWRSR